MKLSLVIPFHNEQGNIAEVLERCANFAPKYDFELICVDDASSDQSPKVFQEILASSRYAFAKLIAVTPQDHRGYGHAIMTGVRAAQGEVIAWTHSDLQADPGDVFRALAQYLKQSDPQTIIQGKRIGRKIGSVLFSLGMGTVASLILGKIFFEINAQPKLFPRSFLPHLARAPEDFSLDLYLLYQAKKHGYPIKRIPVQLHARAFGQSKWGYSFWAKIKTIARTIRYILALRKTAN